MYSVWKFGFKEQNNKSTDLLSDTSNARVVLAKTRTMYRIFHLRSHLNGQSTTILHTYLFPIVLCSPLIMSCEMKLEKNSNIQNTDYVLQRVPFIRVVGLPNKTRNQFYCSASFWSSSAYFFSFYFPCWALFMRFHAKVVFAIMLLPCVCCCFTMRRTWWLNARRCRLCCDTRYPVHGAVKTKPGVYDSAFSHRRSMVW